MNIHRERFTGRIRPEAKKVFDDLDENFKLMYTTEQCQMCGAHLTVRQLNRLIIQGAPPLCAKHYKKMKGEVGKLAEMMEQLSLF